MTESEEIYAMAVELEAEELLGADDQVLRADDIFPILEAIWERGGDLRAAFANGVGPDHQDEDDGDYSVSADQ